jgi:hypothetical protein
LQISGIGTALKILFELDDKAFEWVCSPSRKVPAWAGMLTRIPDVFSPKRNPNLLQRSEIVALINTMHRLSESLYAVETFRKMYAETQRDEQARLAELEGVVAEEVRTASLSGSRERSSWSSWGYPSEYRSRNPLVRWNLSDAKGRPRRNE